MIHQYDDDFDSEDEDFDKTESEEKVDSQSDIEEHNESGPLYSFDEEPCLHSPDLFLQLKMINAFEDPDSEDTLKPKYYQ